MKTKPTDQKTVGRRNFLRGVSAGAVGGTAALAVMPFANQALAGNETADERLKPRYNANSSDVKTYYRVNRYPTNKK